MSEQVARKLDIKQICFIDDSKTSAFVTKKLLKQHGYSVDHFSDAESALEALMEFDYVLLITDLMISSEGGVNGDDLIRLIRQSGHPVKSRIPIVVVTGSSDLATHDNLLHVGADRVLPKPLDGQSLQRTIEELAPQIKDTDGAQSQFTTLQSIKPKSTKKSIEPENIEIKINLDESSELQAFGESEVDNFSESILDKPLSEPALPPKNVIDDDELSKSQDITSEHLSADDFLIASDSTNTPKKEQKKPDVQVAEQLPLHDKLQVELPKVEEKVEKADLEIPILTEVFQQKRKEVTPKLPVQSEPEQQESDPSSEELLSVLLEKIEQQNANKINNTKPEITPEIELPVESVPREEVIQPTVKTEAEDKVKVTTTAEIELPVESVPQEEVIQPKVKSKAENKAKDTTTTDFSKQSYETKEDNPLLTLLGHLEKEEVNFDNEQPFKSNSIFGSKWFKRTFWFVLILALTVPAAVFWLQGQSQTVVETMQVSSGALSTEISVPGRVVSKRKINISARSSGQAVSVAVKEGDKVTKGQLLVQMDDKETKSLLNRSQAQLISIKEVVSQASKMQERFQKALDAGAVSRQRVEDAEAAWKTASAKQSVIEEELKSVKLQLERLKIVAPFDGMISSVSIQEGQWVAAAAPLLNIVDMSQRLAEVKVDVSDSGNLSIGQSILIGSDAFSGEQWEERITKISSEASREDSANIVKVFASLDKSPDELRIGQQLDASIRTAVRSNALQIPFNVLITHQGRPHVAVIDNSQIKFVPVVLGIESASSVEVISGLREGQEIVVPKGQPLIEGMAVTVAGAQP